MIKTGKSYVFFVPPGWLWVGTVVAQGDDSIVLDSVTSTESCQSGTSIMSHLTTARTAKSALAVVRTGWPMPDGVILRRDGARWACPVHFALPSELHRALRARLLDD